MRKHLCTIGTLLLLYIQQFQLSYSATVGLKSNLTIALPWVLMNMLIVAFPMLIALIVFGRIKWALLSNSILFTVLSIANYHVLLFHGSPFFAADIFSIPTAMNVASEYSLVMDDIVIRLIAMMGIELLGWFILFSKEQRSKKLKRKYNAALCVLCGMLIVILFFSPFAVFEKGLFTFTWGPAVNQYGYGVCLFNSIQGIMNPYIKPEDYEPDHILCEDSERVNRLNGEKPKDIILILNESLADLNVYLNTQESNRVFSKLDCIEDLVSGYTTSSLIGGGTNNSEYELLTSNSMQILNVSAPFLSLNMTDANSVVSYLNRLDYTTVGMHCGTASNYNRDNAYVDMGFDIVRLGKESFKYYEKNDHRPWLDRDNYRDMIEVYEACGEAPRFMYLLTYQNHGGYEQNEPEADTVSVGGDYGKYTDDINEFLSSVELSVDAFAELIRYFESSDREVIVMMLGDHAPAFLADMPTNRDMTSGQQEIAKRTVPYYVWSNCGIDTGVFPEYASMIDLVPLLMKAAGMPLTGYYKAITDLNKQVPVRLSTGMYMDAEGKTGTFAPDSPYYESMQNYYYMEYTNLTQKDDEYSSCFELQVN